MIILDLNHIEIISEKSSIVGGFGLGYDYSNVQFSENFNLNKFVRSNVYVSGHIATAESDATAYGPGSMTQTFNSTNTISGFGSSSSGTSISASSGSYYYW